MPTVGDGRGGLSTGSGVGAVGVNVVDVQRGWCIGGRSARDTEQGDEARGEQDHRTSGTQQERSFEKGDVNSGHSGGRKHT